MAKRPVFVPSNLESSLVEVYEIDFEWFPGMALSQSQKSIKSLHDAARKELGMWSALEISSKSTEAVGISLSAFNLNIEHIEFPNEFSVECAYQSSKVFENGGPYVDLLSKSSIEAKRDPRIRDSGKILKYKYFNTEWPLEPTTAFYDWLYIRALLNNKKLSDQLKNYEFFTDIAFNPDRSVNCQAYAAALYVALELRGFAIDELTSTKENFLFLKNQKSPLSIKNASSPQRAF